VFLPATLIASIWGMNVGLPGGGDPGTASEVDFWIILGTLIVVVGAMLGFFRYKRWL
jgi:magnesium transporter